MDSTIDRRSMLHVEDDGWLRKKPLRIINGKNNIMNLNFRNEVKAAA